jgi:hypothetical protein
VARRQQSPEFENYRKTLKCPNGHRYSLTFIEGTGEVVQNLRLRDRLILENPLPRFEDQMASVGIARRLRQLNHDHNGGLSIQRFRLDSMFACATCRGQWPVFVHPEPRIIDTRVTGLSETPVGSEGRRQDQTRSSTNQKCTLEFSYEWAERIEVGFEQLRSQEDTRSASIKQSYHPVEISTGVQQRITESLKVHHSVSSETRTTSTQRNEYELPAGKLTVITIHWKQIWKECECRVRLPDDDSTVLIGYRVAHSMTFDQQVEHI